MDKVTIFFNSTFLHFTQLITGLEYLHQTHKIDLRYEMDIGKYPLDLCKIDYNGKIIFFDLSDSSILNKKVYENSDFYVKRMLLKSDFQRYQKLIPFGLNYQVFYKNNYLKGQFFRNKKMLKYSMRYSGLASWCFNIKDCIRHNNLSNMESIPANGKQIIFRSRLWNPENNEIEWKKEERKKINDERIKINRLLKKNYDAYFKGGIQKDELSLKLCPDLILTDKEYHKSSYVKRLKETSIGIVNPGLEQSISWKFGEFISHSMAILTSPIAKYKLLGEIEEGKNFLVYNDLEECLLLIEKLFSNDNLRCEMQKENQKYYTNYLHPGMKLLRIFELIKRN